MKIDTSELQYVVPGHETEIDNAIETGEADELGLFQNQLYDADIPAPGDWREMLGLNQRYVPPTEIDPPMPPSSFDSTGRIDAERAHRLFLRRDHNQIVNRSQSPKIRQMLLMLADDQRSIDYIRARSLEGRSR